MTKDTTCDICETNPATAKGLCNRCYLRLWRARRNARALDPQTKRAMAKYAASLLMTQGRVKVRLISQRQPTHPPYQGGEGGFRTNGRRGDSNTQKEQAQ